ncbi:unnamed protein product [Ilex paraguariensis]|uniref:Uncharacterized protein n=1 Tax=Ilex paraguariensis TaxID=185542 RepID=A0ABC8RN51_9AQUA
MSRIPAIRTKVPTLDNFNSRCSMSNADVLNHIIPDEEVEEDISAAASSDCSVSIVHLKSDILESEALNLLGEGTYVDTLLTTLPVLSEEEQNAIAATPAHPAGLYGESTLLRLKHRGDLVLYMMIMWMLNFSKNKISRN